jgi:hypothetical protein
MLVAFPPGLDRRIMMIIDIISVVLEIAAAVFLTRELFGADRLISMSNNMKSKHLDKLFPVDNILILSWWLLIGVALFIVSVYFSYQVVFDELNAVHRRNAQSSFWEAFIGFTPNDSTFFVGYMLVMFLMFIIGVCLIILIVWVGAAVLFGRIVARIPDDASYLEGKFLQIGFTLFVVAKGLPLLSRAISTYFQNPALPGR